MVRMWTDEEVITIAKRAANLVSQEFNDGNFGPEFSRNKVVRNAVGEALGAIESGLEWVFDEIDDEEWEPSKGVYAPWNRM